MEVNTDNLLQLGVGGVVAVCLISVVLKFVLQVIQGRESERKALNKTLGSLIDDVHENTIQMKILQDRDKQVMIALRDLHQRVHLLEQHASEVRGAAGRGVLGGKLNTPVRGIPTIDEDEDEEDEEVEN